MTLPSTAVIHTPSSRRPSSELRVTTRGDIPVHEQGAAAFVPVETTALSAAITDAHIAENAPREPTPDISTVQPDDKSLTTQRVFSLFITPPAIADKDAVDKLKEADRIAHINIEDALLTKFVNFIHSHHPDIKFKNAHIDINNRAITKEKPLIVPCRNVGRLEGAFDYSFKRRKIHIQTPTICIIFHHTKPEARSQLRCRHLPRAEFTVKIIDVLYNITTMEIIEGEYNQNAAQEFVDQMKSISID
ncbi:hypothetical protein GCM10023116_25980 [Kistimonas scapharcae]|uniref:Uncharacterized protein n=2 Tax=Kistimonas scapharcae TaxID=1036133 RepID=A0ABP8V5G2_9GAMM